jgi:hypothetical protein
VNQTADRHNKMGSSSLLLLAVATSAGAALLPLDKHSTLRARGAGPTTATAAVTHTEAAVAEEAALISLLSKSGTDGRGASLTAADAAEVHRLASRLEASVPPGSDTNDSPLLPGRWRVLYQGKAGAEVSALSLDSWRKYLAGDGPSPIQNLVSGSNGVSRLYQSLKLDAATGVGRFANVIDFSPAGIVAIDAELEGKLAPSRLGFRFTGGTILLRTLWNGTLSLPYPVPFNLLGDNAKGWLQTDYVSDTLRLSRGNKGSLFVLVPEPDPDDAELEAMLELSPIPTPPPLPETLTKQPVLICPAQVTLFGRVLFWEAAGPHQTPVLICPGAGRRPVVLLLGATAPATPAAVHACPSRPPLSPHPPVPSTPPFPQFGTAADYVELATALSAAGHPVKVAPLKFTDWLRLIPASLTPEYWRGELSPEVALPFYFEALDRAVAELEEEWPGRKARGEHRQSGDWGRRRRGGWSGLGARLAGGLASGGRERVLGPRGARIRRGGMGI